MRTTKPTNSRSPQLAVSLIGIFLLLSIISIQGTARTALISDPAVAHASAQDVQVSIPELPSQAQKKQAQSQVQSMGQPTTPLERLLNKDGTLNLSTGFNGSLDPTGWQIVAGPDERPRFVPSVVGNKQSKTQNHALERRSPERSEGEGSKLKTTPLMPGDESWDDRFYSSSLDGPVYAIAISGANVYVGGRFTSVSRVTVNSIARWNTTSNQWFALGGGVSGASATVNSIVVNSADIYVGGYFTTAGGVSANSIARWNTTSSQWSALGSGASNGVDDFVWAIAISGGNLYAGGFFAMAGGVSANHIARWSIASSQWSALGSGVGSEQFDGVNAIAISGANLYAGGQFATAGGAVANNIARWDTTSSQWYPLGSGPNNGLDGPVYALAISSTNLYAGGSFASAGGTAANNIARWDATSSQWYPYLASGVGNNPSDYVGALLINGTDVYVGGSFTIAGGVSANNIVRCDTAGCHPLATGADGVIDALAFGGANLYVSGYFTSAGGVSADNIARWGTTSSQWFALGSGSNNGLDGPVYAIGVGTGACACLGNVYLGGYLNTAGGVSARNIAQWDGNQWHSLGSGPNNGANGVVKAIAITGTDVYVGGVFTATGGISANNIARWNATTSQWFALGSGLTFNDYGGVNAIAISGTNVYAGGYFSTAGGTLANNIARWDATTSQWFALGSGVGSANDSVYALAISGSNVYAGGSFSAAGGTPANNIARWDATTSQWFALGSGVGSSIDDSVNAIGIAGSNVYAGGYFSTAGGIPASNIARWDATSSQWHPLGGGAINGVDGGVQAITVSGIYVYAGGYFATAGGIPSNNIARWDATSSQWYPLGSGVDNGVYSVGVNGLDVHVGGDFAVAGNKPSVRFGIWHDPGLVAHMTWQGRPAPPDARLQLPVTLTLKLGATEINFPVQSSSSGAYLTTAVGTLPAGTYTWRVKNPKYLANSGAVTLTGAPITNLDMGLMLGGDANNDNAISGLDFNIMKVSYGKGIGDPQYDDRADFNGDRLVNVLDFLLVKLNFGQGGAPPIAPGGH